MCRRNVHQSCTSQRVPEKKKKKEEGREIYRKGESDMADVLMFGSISCSVNRFKIGVAFGGEG